MRGPHPTTHSTDQPDTAMQRGHCPTRGLPSAARLTKHRTPTSCVPLCVFAASRATNRPPPPPRNGNLQAASRTGQISGWKARATFIRVHSCSFVVQNHPHSCPFVVQNTCIRAHSYPFVVNSSSFVSIRVHSWFKTPLHSCPFVVQNGPRFVSIRGSKRPPRRGRFVIRCSQNPQVPRHQGGSNGS